MGPAWVVTRYEDVVAILKDQRFIKDRQKFTQAESGQSGAPAISSATLWWRNMLTVDPPDHTRLRGLIAKAFTPRMIEQLRPNIQQIANELLDAQPASGG